MKKIICLLLLLSSPVFAARAGYQIDFKGITGATDPPNAKVVRWPIDVTYQGGDVPNEPQNTRLIVTVSSSALPSTIQAAMVAAVQAEATNRGFTVAPGNTLAPTFTSQ